MSGSDSSDRQIEKDLQALEQRAQEILKARSAYREMVDFYLTVFRRQIEWRGRLVVHPETVDDRQRRQCLGKGDPLIERYDPGLDSESLLDLWTEMKTVFARGNEVLQKAVEKISEAEKTDQFVPAAWLLEQRPDRHELVADTSRQIGVDEPILASLARAVTLPHWQMVAHSWLQDDRLDEWKRSRCPTCGGLPALAESSREGGGGENIVAAARHSMHCPFCGSSWTAPALKCPACDSTKPGDAKYFFTEEEPELRIDFCKSCNHYIKVIDTDKITAPIHAGLELLASAHLDTIAQDKNLRPLEVCS